MRRRRGARGPAGAAALNGNTIARLAADLMKAQNELQVQFKRIAQLQAELDDLRANLRKSPTRPDTN